MLKRAWRSAESRMCSGNVTWCTFSATSISDIVSDCCVCLWVECLRPRAWVHLFIYTNFLAWMLPYLCICRVCVNLARTSSLTVRFCPEALSVTWSHYLLSRSTPAPCFRVQLNAQFHAMTLAYAFVTMAAAFGDGALHSVPVDILLDWKSLTFLLMKSASHLVPKL